jgi:hypothetical protein
MFFRREKPTENTFETRIANLKQYGFESVRQSTNKSLVTRGPFAAMVESLGEGNMKIDKAGVKVGDEIATLVNGGYQMFLHTPSGKQFPALAPHLKGLHAFDEDLREGLGMTSLYNLALGTTTDEHLYDRVVARDKGEPVRPWEK